MITFIQLLISGISVGFIYGLIAVGFVLIYKSSQIFNFAQGEMVMFGAFLMWYFSGTSGNESGAGSHSGHGYRRPSRLWVGALSPSPHDRPAYLGHDHDHNWNWRFL